MVRARHSSALRLPTALLGLLALLLALAACGPSAPQVERLPAQALILAFGDSLTHGTGAGDGESYPAVLERLIGLRVVAEGAPGEVSGAGLARLAGALDRHRPDLLILCHGGNDLWYNLRAMIEAARQRNIAVVLIGVPRPSVLRVSEGAGLYRALAADFALPYEAAALAEILGQRTLKADMVHPNAAGYRKLAEAVAVLLRASGAI